MKPEFARRVQKALADEVLQQALDRNASRRKTGREAAFASFPESELVRQQAREIRGRTIDQLDLYLDQFKARLEANGFQVHWADDAEKACELIVSIAQQAEAKLVSKSKSMVTEEIELNHALGLAGIEAVETDLGEYIVQLRGEKPAHITAPAVHLTREQVAETFVEFLDVPYNPEVEFLTAQARRQLRQVFLSSQVGVSGVNFGVAETGSLCIVTNEGNGRMVTTLPPVHIAVMGIERLVPTLEDLALMLELLPRSATGQVITSYVSLLQGPRREADPDGPLERHVVLVDNGRLSMAASNLREALLCIRCGACLNACPVFQEIGGHAYGSVYPGPIGSVVSPGLFGLDDFGHLAKASTLCGACREACPIHIDLPGLLLRVRDERGQGQSDLSPWRVAMRLFARLACSPVWFDKAQRWGYRLGWLLPRRQGWFTHFPPVWSNVRDFPALPKRSFRRSFQEESEIRPVLPSSEPTNMETVPIQPIKGESSPPLAAFQEALETVDGEFVLCSPGELPDRIVDCVLAEGADEILSWSTHSAELDQTFSALEQRGVSLAAPVVPAHLTDAREQALTALSRVKVGLTEAAAGLADSGTIVVQSGENRSQLASLLPEVHLVILRSSQIYPNRRVWAAEQGMAAVRQSAAVHLITGPSRTADIEMTLTVGVHGPRRVIVYCLQDQ